MGESIGRLSFIRQICIVVFVSLLWIASGLTEQDASTVEDRGEKIMGKLLQKSMIWVASAPPGRQAYVAFRKTFDLQKKPEKATLRIFADTRYMLWINGKYIDNGPCRFDPKRPEYDVHDVRICLRKGRNAIAVVVHHYAIGSFREWSEQCARMMDHRPGLTADLTMMLSTGKGISVRTDESWRANRHTRYLPSPGTYTTVPDNIDARIDEADWTAADFDDTNWERTTHVDGKEWGTLCKRSIPLLRKTVYEPLRTKLPLTISEKKTIDVGRCVQAYVKLDFEAAEGVELIVNPHDSRYGHGTMQYITRKGRQTYITGDTAGFSRLNLQVKKGAIVLHKLEVVDRRYPYDRLGRFACNDQVLNRLWKVGVNTVEVCSEDAYVDCADRERAQWMADGYMMSYPVSRVALARPGHNGAHCYSDPCLLKNMLRHMGLSQLHDGRLQPMRPSNYPVTEKHGVIDDYSCLWVHAIRELCDRTGDEAFVREVWPTIVKALDYFLNRRTERGLVNAVEFIYFNNPLAYVRCEGTSINAYVYRALRDAAHVGRRIGQTNSAKRFDKAATELYQSCNEHLWDAKAGSYYGSIMMDDPSIKKDTPPSFSQKYKGRLLNGNRTPATGHAALMALYFDLVPAERHEQVFKFMLQHLEKERPYPYTCRYFLDVLYRKNSREMDVHALNFLRRKFGPMARNETGTTREDWGGGSGMHEAGAHPAYFLSAYVLGVRTQYTAGGLELCIEPRLGNLKEAAGVVLCEYGPVPVSWKRTDENQLTFNFSIPKGVDAVVSIPTTSNKATLAIDRKTLLHKGTVKGEGNLTARYFTVKLKSGDHSGVITP